MQDWDRLAMIGVGLLVDGYTVWASRRLWRRRKYVSLVGVALLLLATLAVPVALALVAS